MDADDPRAPVTQREIGYYAGRLDDPGLLDGAVVAPSGQLAVPVGGRRLSGSVSCVDDDEMRQVARDLEGRPGFPGVRCSPAGVDEEHGVQWAAGVAWGEPASGGHAALGRAYGYSDEAIATFTPGV